MNLLWQKYGKKVERAELLWQTKFSRHLKRKKAISIHSTVMILRLKEKIETVAKEIYGADGVTYSPAAERELKRITDLGMANFPVCMAKTQYSLSDDAKKLGRPTGFKINVREVYVSAGAGFVVAVNGSIMTLPGLPKKPAAYGIDVNDDGVITGLF